MRLSDQPGVEWADEKQVISVAALMMRRVLTDYARNHQRQKRWGGLYRVDLADVNLTGGGMQIELLALDEALERFCSDYPDECKVIELRFFGGLSIKEVADVLGVSESTVSRDFSFARAWLLNELGIA